MSLFNNHAGFNISGTKLQLVEVDYKDNEFYLENVDEEYFNEFWSLSDNETKIINILQTAYNEIILRKPLNTQLVSFSIPHKIFKIYQVPIDSGLSSNDLKDHLKWETSVLFPKFDPNEFIIQHVENNIESESKVKNAIVFAVFKKYMKTIHKFCVRNNLVLKFIDNAHIASNSFVTHNNEDKKTVSLYLDENQLSVSVTSNKNLVNFRIINVNNISEVTDKLLDELSNLNGKNGFEEFDEFFIAGENIPQNLVDKLNEAIGSTFQKINPFARIKINPTLQVSDFVQKKPHSFSASAGIALRIV